jgi:hypothetical protein
LTASRWVSRLSRSFSAIKGASGEACGASLDTRFYETKLKTSDEAKASVRLSRHNILPQWNYTIRPRKRNGQVIS